MKYNTRLLINFICHRFASGYKFVFSLDVTDLVDPERSPPVLHSLEGRNDEAGTEQTHSFLFRHK